MPKLWKYKPSSEKSGYYIRANVGGSHPITLQVTTVAQIIFEQTNYKPNQSVPTKLVWAMYDIDLLYTNKSLDPSKFKDISTEDVLRELDLGNQLSHNERKMLISYIEEYGGTQKSELTQLKKELEIATSPGYREQVGNGYNQFNEQDVPETVDEAIAHIYTMTHDVRRYREVKRGIDKTYLLQSLQTFVPHPYVDSTKAKISNNYMIRYPITHPNNGMTCWLRDHRGQVLPHEYRDADYICKFFNSKDIVAVIEDEQVTDFTPTNSRRYDLQSFESDLEWILPPDPVEVDEVEYNKEDHIEYDAFTEYDGRLLQPLRHVRDKENIDVQIARVDRVSNNGNPVIEVNNSPYILGEGEPGEEYLVENTGNSRWKVISKVVR